MVCYRCGEPVDAGVSYCPDCGEHLEEAREYLLNDTCPDCQVAADGGVCPECGLEIADAREGLTADAAAAGASTAAGGDGERPDAAGGEGGAGGDGQATTDSGEQSVPATGDASEAPTPREAADGKTTHREGLSQDEVYCIDCGTIINRRAEMCPDCGMNQVPPGGWESDSQDHSGATRKDEKIARKDLNTNVLLGIFLPPVAYLNLGKPLLAVINLVTFNYLLLGFVAVPYHAYAIIRDARKRVLDGGGTR